MKASENNKRKLDFLSQGKKNVKRPKISLSNNKMK